jgi:dUTP pyrophosphatase
MQCVLLDPNARVPTRATRDSAGFDLYSVARVVVPAKGFATIPIGVGIRIPDGFYGMIASRSGLMSKNGIFAGTGIIDSDYRGDIRVVLYNMHPQNDFVVGIGDRIAQLLVQRHENAILGYLDLCSAEKWAEMVSAETSSGRNERGTRGFGSSGVSS